MDYSTKELEEHSDERGRLIIFLTNSELQEEKKEFGQIYFVTFNGKGVVRGNHFHKKWREWFSVVTGTVQVELEDVITKEHVSLTLSSCHQHYTRLEIGPNVAHSFKSISSSASLLNYGDKEWSVDDTYFYVLIREK